MSFADSLKNRPTAEERDKQLKEKNIMWNFERAIKESTLRASDIGETRLCGYYGTEFSWNIDYSGNLNVIIPKDLIGDMEKEVTIKSDRADGLIYFKQTFKDTEYTRDKVCDLMRMTITQLGFKDFIVCAKDTGIEDTEPYTTFWGKSELRVVGKHIEFSIYVELSW